LGVVVDLGSNGNGVLCHNSEGRCHMKNQLLAEAIERDPQKVSGAWVFRGTRVPLSALFENLKDGASIDEFLEWFPGVRREQVIAVLDFELAALDTLVEA
jgi:uncharacterized protein (DUF433 family)